MPRAVIDVTEAATIFPIEITGGSTAQMTRHSLPVPGRPFIAQRIAVSLCDDRRIVMKGPTTLSSVLAMVEGLTA